jgi:endonuclease/exonuclease/phosphatase family metal-dependent hydrolase
MSLKLISLNIERAKHLDRFHPFLQTEHPDVFCVQEVREQDVDRIALQMNAVDFLYAPMLRHPADGEESIIGVAMFSRAAMQDKRIDFYVGSGDTVPWHDPESKEKGTMMNCALLSAVIGGIEIGTTHFTWSPNGAVTDTQMQSARKLLQTLESFKELVLCGDFNAPRGREIYEILAAKFRDNIPLQYETSLDYDLHRAGEARLKKSAADLGLTGLMVDYLFTTPGYRASEVRLDRGVSDHMAIVATISRTELS